MSLNGSSFPTLHTSGGALFWYGWPTHAPENVTYTTTQTCGQTASWTVSFEVNIVALIKTALTTLSTDGDADVMSINQGNCPPPTYDEEEQWPYEEAMEECDPLEDYCPPPPVEGECMVLITYWTDTGEIVSVDVLYCW